MARLRLAKPRTASHLSARHHAWATLARVGMALLLAGCLSMAPAVVDRAMADDTESVTPTPTPDATGSVTPTPTPDATASVTPTPTPDATGSVTPTPTAVFARTAKGGIQIYFPAPAAKLIAVGFHQADNRKGIRFVPTMSCHGRDKPTKTRAWLKKDSKRKLFQQSLRGRGSSNFSAADCAVRPKTVVLAPATGVVTAVKRYKLYGYIDDYRVEIRPTGAKHLRVALIHILGVKVKVGDVVVGGVTPVATVRHLKLDSTVNHYLPVKPADHVHIQVNLDTYKHPGG